MFRKTLVVGFAVALAVFAAAAWAGTGAAPEMSGEEVLATANGGGVDQMLPLALFAFMVITAVALLPVGGCPSDRRLKTDITRVGTTDQGLPLYRFRYIGQRQMWEGVMAQDVLELRPDAVTDIGGYMAVKYPMLGLEMRAVS